MTNEQIIEEIIRVGEWRGFFQEPVGTKSNYSIGLAPNFERYSYFAIRNDGYFISSHHISEPFFDHSVAKMWFGKGKVCPICGVSIHEDSNHTEKHGGEAIESFYYHLGKVAQLQTSEERLKYYYEHRATK